MQKYFLLLFLFVPYLLFAQNEELSTELKNEVDSLQKVLKETKADSISKRIELLEAIAKPYRIKNSALAIDYLQKALKLAQTEQLQLKSANLNSELGQIYVKDGNIYEGIKYFNQALDLMKKLPSEELNYYIYIDIGNVYYAEKLFDAALPYYEEALKGFQSKADSNGINLSYRNLGITHNYLNQADSARHYFFKALEYIQDRQIEEKGILYNYIAISYKTDKNFKEAIKWAQKAIDLDASSTTESGFNQSSSLFNLGLYYEFSNMLDSAIYYYEAAKSAGFSSSVNIVSMAACHVKLKNYEEALSLLAPWITDSSAFETLHVYDQQVSYQTLIKIYEAKGQFKKALEYAQKLQKLLMKRVKSKPISSPLLKFSKATANLQKDYEIQQKEAENLYQKDINQKQAQLSSIYLWGFIIVGILLIILAYLFWNIQKFNKSIRAKNATIAQKNRQLAAFNQTQTKLFSIIAHDLRTPFSQLIGFSEQILGQGPEKWSSTQQKVKTMGSSARQAYFLFEDLLGWARTQTGDLNTQKEQLYLPELIRKAQAPIESLLKAKDIQLQIINEEKIYWLDADPYMLQTILRNILSNAIRYSPKGASIRIELKKQGKRALFKIKDQGEGIAEEALNKIFDEEKWINSKSNSGLGLVLCKEFVEAHQGQIKAYNEQGAVFEFDLPLAKEQLPKVAFEKSKTENIQEKENWEKLSKIKNLHSFKERVEQLEIFDATKIAKLKQEFEKYEEEILYQWIQTLEEAAYAFEESEFEQLKQLFLSKI